MNFLSLNLDFLKWLSMFRTEMGETIFRLFSYFGEVTVLLPILCISYWCINKRISYKALYSFLISGALVQGLKVILRIPRPWILDPTFSPSDNAIKTATGYSCPSGHTQSSTSVIGSFATNTKTKWLSVICWIICIIVLFSRMYLGVHTPLDVTLSFLMSFAVILIVNYVEKNIEITKNHKIIFLSFSIIYAIVFILYSLLLIRWNLSTKELVTDTITMAVALVGLTIGSYIETSYIKFNTATRNIFFQIVKIVLGIAGLLAIEIGTKTLIPDKFIYSPLSTFFICLWATCIFPLFIKLVEKKEYSDL